VREACAAVLDEWGRHGEGRRDTAARAAKEIPMTKPSLKLIAGGARNRFADYLQGGFPASELHAVIPPDATLAPESSGLAPERGKIPASTGPNPKTWTGAKGWPTRETHRSAS